VEHIRRWYSDCKKTIEQLYGADSRLFTLILAAASPRKSVKANWRLAVKVFKILKQHLTIENIPGLLPCHKLNILRIINGMPLSGNKVMAFADNLLGNLQAVTIDVWVKRFYANKTAEQIENHIRRGAKCLKMQPAEYQALIWTKARQQAGRNAISFNNVPDLFQLKLFKDN